MPRRPPNPGNPDQTTGPRWWIIELSRDGRLWARHGRPHASLRNACQSWRHARSAHPRGTKVRYWNAVTRELRDGV